MKQGESMGNGEAESSVIDLDKGFFSVESQRRRTERALSMIPHSLFSWMSSPLTVQAEDGMVVKEPCGSRWTVWCWGEGAGRVFQIAFIWCDASLLQLSEWHMKDSTWALFVQRAELNLKQKLSDTCSYILNRYVANFCFFSGCWMSYTSPHGICQYQMCFPCVCKVQCIGHIFNIVYG